MNNYTKGPGDYEPECIPEPTDAQIVAAIRNHADKVAANALDNFRQELKTALITLAKFNDDDAVRSVMSDSAKDLLFRECI